MQILWRDVDIADKEGEDGDALGEELRGDDGVGEQASTRRVEQQDGAPCALDQCRRDQLAHCRVALSRERWPQAREHPDRHLDGHRAPGERQAEQALAARLDKEIERHGLGGVGGAAAQQPEWLGQQPLRTLRL